MNSCPGFELDQLYDTAARHTLDAASALDGGDLTLAYEKLEQRKALVRAIQRGMDHAPAWGSDARADLAALRYIAADRALEGALDRFC